MPSLHLPLALKLDWTTLAREKGIMGDQTIYRKHLTVVQIKITAIEMCTRQDRTMHSVDKIDVFICILEN